MIAMQHNAARNGMELSFRNASLHSVKFFATCSRCQHIAAARCHSRKNLSDLFRSFAGRIDHLRHTDAQGTVVVNLREAEIFEGEMA